MPEITPDPFGPDGQDSELMERTRKGERAAFELLVRRHQPALLNFFRRLGAYNEAEDLVQETFIRLYNYRDRYRSFAGFRTFLYTIARHAWIDLLRKTRRRAALTEKVRQEIQPGHDGEMGRVRARLDVQVALNRLPDKLKGVVVLNLYQGLRYEEIAQALHIPLGTVKSRMFLALNRLREMFDDERTESHE